MLIRNNFDGGTNNTGMSTGNTGGASGNAFTAVEASAIFSNEQARSGTLSMKTPSTGVSGYGRWSIGEDNVAIRSYIYCTAAHTADYNFIQGRVTTDNATGFATVRMTGASNLRLYIHASASNAWTSSATFPLNQWVRVEALFKLGSTTSDGEARIAYFLGDSPTPVQDSGWITSLNLRGDTGSAGQVFIGKVQTTSYGGNFYLDSVAINAGSDYNDFIGADVQPLETPTVTVTSKTNPTTVGGDDGTVTIGWAAIDNADHYEVAVEEGNVSGDFDPVDTTESTTYTFEDMTAGTYTFAVRAMAG